MSKNTAFATQFPVQPEFPSLIHTLDGTPIDSAEKWRELKRPELLKLIQECEYGIFPPASKFVTAKVLYENKSAYDGKAWLRELELTWGAEGFAIHLLLVTPNHVEKCPVFAGLNFPGNHSLVPDEGVAITDLGMSTGKFNGGPENPIGEAGRNLRNHDWEIEAAIDRGFGIATAYKGDLVPDNVDGAFPRLREFRKQHCPDVPEEKACAALAVWAWGLIRIMDYLQTDPTVDSKRIAAVGHSRLGKTALLAGVFDERFALIIPSQAGCGGTAPARIGEVKEGSAVETVQIITGGFPYWFCQNFTSFGPDPERLPYDHDAVIALCAPRPLLLSNASEDDWAHPAGQFRCAQSADKIYKLLGSSGLEIDEMPGINEATLGQLGYFLREGGHSMGTEEWKVWWPYAERWL